jgi:HYR domain
MGRSTAISRFFSLLRAGSAATALLATILSCSDNSTAPSVSQRDPALAGVRVYVNHVPDSLKHPLLQVSATRMLGGLSVSRNVTVDPSAPAAPSTYTISTIDFAPEPSPIHRLIPNPERPELVCDDCVAIVPIGFPFTFYGNSYSELRVTSNGLVGFTPADSLMDGCCGGWQIPVGDDYNNIIAVAWTDLTPSVDADIRFEIQGTAPNRKFVVQWNNVPEAPEYPTPSGHVTAQLVLSEGTNDITMYTTSMVINGRFHPVTQGIENADGSEAAYLPGRVQDHFTLSNDAIRFSIRPAGKPITLVASANLEVGTDPGQCVATVALIPPAVSGGGDGLSVAGFRADKLPLDAIYPKGITTITWTATDASGLTELATQTVTVADHESPRILPPANVVVPNDPGLASAFVNVGVAQVDDNCPNNSINEPANGVYPVGITNVVWTATDESGNTGSATQLVTVKDVEAPTIDLPSALTVNATSPAGALVSFASFGHDNVGVTSFSCTPVSGTRFPIGRTLVSCSAVDAAGNKSASASLSVTVLGAQQQIANLIESIKGFLPIGGGKFDEHRDNYDDRDNQPSGRQGNQLLSALSSALSNSRSTRAACPALNMIVAMVRTKTPAVFPPAISAQILADVARIKNVIGCSGERRND